MGTNTAAAASRQAFDSPRRGRFVPLIVPMTGTNRVSFLQLTAAPLVAASG